MARMLLPAELIDYTFSFLRGDIPTLKVCSKTDPLLSRLAERYLYADIVVGSDAECQCYELLSKNPHVLYPRTLEIHATVCFQDYLPIFAMIPRMANLTSLKLCEGTMYFDRGLLSNLFENYLRQSSVERVHLSSFYKFPLSILKNLKNIKKLTLTDCSSTRNTTSDQPLRIETLIIRGSLDERLLSQITGQVVNLKSLQLPEVGLCEWNAVSELVAAYSNSLTELHLYVEYAGFVSLYDGRQNEFLISLGIIDKARWTHINTELPLALSSYKFLKHLAIFAPVKPKKGMVWCALPAIMSLVKTAPAIQDLFLQFHWVDSHRGSLAVGQLDWSLLEYDSPRIRPRIHLFISSDTEGHPIPSATILEVLTQNETLMDLVKREVITLKAERIAPLGD